MAVNISTKTKTPKEEKQDVSSKKPSFLKTGAEAAGQFKAEEAKAEAAKEQAGKMWRWRIGTNSLDTEFRITFLDGEINEYGLLDTPTFREHSVFFNNKWQTFTAVEDEPDPITEETGQDPSFVQVFTIIDHTEYTKKDGTTVKDQRKLFVCKRQTIKLLTNIAKKRGGLTGATFDVMRTGEKVASVGDNFDFVEKQTLQELSKQYGEDSVLPADYAEEIPYYTRDQLLEMGFGNKNATISAGAVNEDDLDDNL